MNQRVIVTAGARGIGRAIAERFRASGASVWVCDVDPDAVAAVRREAPEITGVQADVTDETAVAGFLDEAVAAMGGIDVLVNNAGIAGPTGPVETLQADAWRQCLAVNLDGAFFATKHAVPRFKEAGGGAIVNLASTAGLFGYPGRTPYAAAKWAIVGFTKSLAMELGPFGVRVNAIAPGAVEGDRMDRVIAAEAKTRGLGEEEVRASYVAQTSMRTFVTVHDIAAMAHFLASDAARHVSGQVIAVDGDTQSLTPQE